MQEGSPEILPENERARNMKVNYYANNNDGAETSLNNVTSVDFYREKVICYTAKDFKYDVKEIPLNRIISIER